MPEVNRQDYFQGGKFLKGDDIPAKGATFTITAFEEIKTRIGLRPCLRLKGVETPLGLNATRFDFMVTKYGSNTDHWEGKRITLSRVRVNDPQKKQTVNGIELS